MVFKKNKEPINSVSLTNITRGMHHAAMTTTSMVAQQYVRLFEQFFDREDPKDPDSPLKAKMVEIKLGDNHSMYVPLISMVAPKGIVMDRMKVSMSVKMEEIELKKATTADNAEQMRRGGFTVSFQSNKRSKGGDGRYADEIAIDMEFQAIEPPEGIMRVIEEYTNLIGPVSAATPEPPKQDEKKAETSIDD
ncbi:DUF2589 domain-containing protein [Endozoicomonas sp. SM1973]|uniref:DUF2589 domain-containing protein n=1 Tax=Spartinivicinus marinus TaxID=2994442 RepID=A0A853I4S5_9GAMM|nr:DUF2589 domain-containing protein [Spartinivicinus marinus]MCX4029569.1 DUF2589 domain-containing protein [Spartinivicinus marinus]NYZ65144.1 DUF2589 domain-containing protein [Spartinivicinus marinus]